MTEGTILPYPITERLSFESREILKLAHEEALALNHDYMGTGHILLALVRIQNYKAGAILRVIGCTYEVVLNALVFIIGRADSPPRKTIKPTTRFKRVILEAGKEAERFNSKEIDTQHLLLGILDEGEGFAAGILVSIGYDLGKTEKLIREKIASEKEKEGE